MNTHLYTIEGYPNLQVEIFGEYNKPLKAVQDYVKSGDFNPNSYDITVYWNVDGFTQLRDYRIIEIYGEYEIWKGIWLTESGVEFFPIDFPYNIEEYRYFRGSFEIDINEIVELLYEGCSYEINEKQKAIILGE